MDLPANTYLTVSEWIEIILTEVIEQSDILSICCIRRYLVQTLYLLHDIFMERGASNNDQLKKCPVDILLDYIHVNYEKEISLNSLCELVHTNRTTLNRRFKEKTGYTAIEYLLTHRVRISCDILARTHLSLSEVAERVGFRHDTYLIKQFIAKMGESPTEYRKNTKKKATGGSINYCKNRRSQCEASGYCNVFWGHTVTAGHTPQ